MGHVSLNTMTTTTAAKKGKHFCADGGNDYMARAVEQILHISKYPPEHTGNSIDDSAVL